MRTFLICLLRIGIGAYLLLFPSVLLFIGMEAAREAGPGQAAAGCALTTGVLLVPLIGLWTLLRLLTRKGRAALGAHEGQARQ